MTLIVCCCANTRSDAKSTLAPKAMSTSRRVSMSSYTLTRLERRSLFKCGAVLAALGIFGMPRAQDAAWPAKPVRLILPFTPGGATDFQGRILCDMLTREFRQQFFIDYKPGAGSHIGVAA